MPVAVVPDYGLDVEAGYGIQVAVLQRIAAHLHVLAEEFHVAHGGEEAHLGGIQFHVYGIGRILQRIRLHRAFPFALAVGDNSLSFRGFTFLPAGQQRLLGRGLFRGTALALLLGLGSSLGLGVGIVLRGFLGSLCSLLGGLAAVSVHGILVHRPYPSLRDLFHVVGDVAHLVGDVAYGIGTHVQGVYLVLVVLLLRAHGHRGLPLHGHEGEGVLIEDVVGHSGHVAGRILDMGVAQQEHVLRDAVEKQRIRPGLLLLGKAVDVLLEEEYLVGAVVPAPAGGKHVPVLPEVHVGYEIGCLALAVVDEVGGLHEHGIRVHVDLVLEGEQLLGALVGAFAALDDLAVLVPHRPAAAEDGDTVLGIVVQVAGAQDVVFLVAELDGPAAELRQVVVDVVVQLLAGQHRLVLDELHVPPAVDDLAVHVPHGGVADEVGAVMQEGRLHRLAVVAAEFFYEFDGMCLHQAHERVRLRLLLRKRRPGGQQQQCREGEGYSSLNFFAHPARENSQSLKRGSMVMYVLSILSSMNLSMASICLAFFTICSSVV